MSFLMQPVIRHLVNHEEVCMAKIRSTGTLDFQVKWWLFSYDDLNGLGLYDPEHHRTEDVITFKGPESTPPVSFEAKTDWRLTIDTFKGDDIMSFYTTLEGLMVRFEPTETERLQGYGSIYFRPSAVEPDDKRNYQAREYGS